MNKEQINQAVTELYTEFYRQVTLNKSFTFRSLPADVAHIRNFTDWLLTNYTPHQIGITFLIDYFKFQFSRYAGIKTQYGRNAIMIQWLVGAKAQKVWLEQKHSKKWLVTVRLRKTVEIRLIKAFQEQIVEDNLVEAIQNHISVHDYEEVAKKRFFNTIEGFMYCHSTTTLYNGRSEYCSSCKLRENCINMLKKQYPKLHKIRMTYGR